MVPDSHYSFGSKNECPHICFPLASAMDTFIVTPEGELPPKLGPEMFPKTNDRLFVVFYVLLCDNCCCFFSSKQTQTQGALLGSKLGNKEKIRNWTNLYHEFPLYVP